MTSLATMPSLSEDGWVTDSVKVADYLLSHFFLSEYSQTYIYHQQVSSLPWILQVTQGDMSATIDKTRRTLSEYFSRYFNNVEVEVLDVTSEETPSKAAISIYIKFTDKEGKEHVFGKFLEMADLTITKIVNINNG